MPSYARCLQWGALLREAVTSFPAPLRVAVLGSGGMSHSIGEPTMGRIDEAFDARCCELLRDGDPAALAAYLESATDAAGNGAHEMRNWAIAHAAAGARGFELLDYLAVQEVYVGCGWAAWDVRAV